MSICDKCIHDEVCGLEDNHEEGIVMCANMIPKTGHWEGSEGDIDVLCSECGDVGYAHYNYCPNCGARMESETRNEIL